MHGNTDMTKENMTKLKIKNTYVPRLFGKPSLFTKIKLKWPLSKGNHFKIYFRLECRRNRGSRQDFHGVFFFEDRILINPDHFVTYRLMITYLSNKNKQFTSKHEAKKYRHEHWLIRTKLRNKTTNRACIRLSFFCYFSMDSNKQNKLVNNN